MALQLIGIKRQWTDALQRPRVASSCCLFIQFYNDSFPLRLTKIPSAAVAYDDGLFIMFNTSTPVYISFMVGTTSLLLEDSNLRLFKDTVLFSSLISRRATPSSTSDAA